MSLVRLTIVLALATIALARSHETEISAKGLEVAPVPVKIDKNLRRALLKALADLEAESAEQHKSEDDGALKRDVTDVIDIAKKDLNKDLGTAHKSTFSFSGFPGDEKTPNEDKLQNSSFVATGRFTSSSGSTMTIEKASTDDARSFHVQNVILPEKNSVSYSVQTEKKLNELEAKKLKNPGNSVSVTKVESVTLKAATSGTDSLAGSASSGIATANALIAPKPSADPTGTTKSGGALVSSESKEKSEEVKIFQAPLVAAFTVQQDERGVPKSVVPIYRSSGDGQALTLQEQLDFKQKLLEKQLAELQQQQLQQTQFLLRQRQLYEQQLRQKQYHQLYLQDQTRIRQFEEQARLKQLEEQRLKQLEEQRLYRFQQVHSVPQKQRFFEQPSNALVTQQTINSNVHLQPSVALELPHAAAPPPFQVNNFQDQLRLQQLRQQQQQRLQQSFSAFQTDVQASLPPATRFHRQEAFNAVGNFGFNLENKPTPTRSNFGFSPPVKPAVSFAYNPYTQFRQTRPATPAKQIQHLLYQSGIAGELGNVQGSGGQEDLNIVSKVLALNVGAVPGKNLQYTNNQGIVGKAAA